MSLPSGLRAIVERRCGAPPDAGAAFLALDKIKAAASADVWPAPDRAVVLYGAGELGQLALAWCRQNEVSVQAVVDAGAPRWRGHTAWRGTPVLTPDEVPPAWGRELALLLCISSLPLAPLDHELRLRGWHRVEPFYDFARRWPAPHPMHNGWRASWPAAVGEAAWREVLAGWRDDVSRAHHLQFAAWRVLRHEWAFEGAPVEPGLRWSIPEFESALRTGERLLDGGAHRGQLVERWLTCQPGRLAEAWMVEPDPDHGGELRRRIAEREAASSVRLHHLPMALSRRPGRRTFATGCGYGCRLWSHGGAVVPVVRMDDLMLAPTVIKLHLEGHEWPALQGAVATLTRHRPMLAATVYHRRDGLFATAHWLMRTLPRYRWHFRLHGWAGTGAVIYGVPEEREESR